MEIISKLNDNLIDRINKIILVFKDESEVTLDKITDWGFDFNKKTNSQLYIANALNNVKLFNQYDQRIMFVRIEFKVVDLNELNDKNEMIMNIPCSMSITKIKCSKCINSFGEMQVTLEGIVY